jgi:hypothetical protein
MMVWFGFRNNENTRKDTLARERILSNIIDENRKNLEALHKETRDILKDIVDRNSKAMEGCLSRQQRNRVQT